MSRTSVTRSGPGEDALPDRVPLAPGALVAGRFEIERPAGAGGMGMVYRARDRESGARVALKVLHAEAEAPDERFVREVRALASFAHAAIVRYVDHGIAESGARWLATEWLEGEDLAVRLTRGPLPLEDVLAAGIRAADALAAAHERGVVHRDVKPANLFVPPSGVAELKVLDFGLARLAGTSLRPTMTGTMMGTPAYMAPEQARGARELDGRADVFALGCVLYECVAGRPAFVGDNVMAVLAKVLLQDPDPLQAARPETPPALAGLIARMTAKEPASRPPMEDVGRVLEALRAAPGATPVPVAPGLTRGEQRLLSVVFAGGGGEGGDAIALDLVRAAAEAYGALAERLADGSIVVALAGSGAATDQVAQAARCALAVRAFLPGSALALATGLGVVGGTLPAGEAIDRAAALVQARAHEAPAGVLMDEATAGLLDARFEVTLENGVAVLLGERELAEGSRTLLGRPSPTVGRDRELQTLDALFDECVSEPAARAALVTAPAGTGKSRVGHEFLNGVRRREKPVIIWIGRGDPISAGSPFGMIAPAIRRAAGILDGEPLAMRQLKLRVRIARHLAGADALRATEFLGELIGVPFPDEKSLELRAARQDSRLMGDQMMRAWQDWLMAECSTQPVLIVLEDLHWGDTPTVSFTDAALRHLKDRPLMVLALARPEVHDVFPRLWAERSAQEIRLGELTRRASERLVREVLGDSVAAETVERVVSLAAGNAFYLEELIRTVADGRAEGLPETVLAMVEARLQSLEPEARRVLRAASLFGQSFWRGAVAVLLGGSEGAARLDDLLRDLEAGEFITRRPGARFAGEEEFQFRHELVRAAAYAMLTPDDRRLGHRLAAEWLECSGEQEAVTLAEHWERGGVPGRAVGHWLKATRQALEGDDFASVHARAERGGVCGAAGEMLGHLRLLQTEAFCWQGEFQRSLPTGREASELLERGSNAYFRAFQLIHWAASTVGDLDECRRSLDKLVEAAPTGEWTIFQIGQIALSLPWLDMTGFRERADELTSRILEVMPAQNAHEPLDRGHAFTGLAISGMYRGDPSVYIRYLEEGLALYRQAGSLRHECLNVSNMGYAYCQVGRFEEAERELRRGLEQAERRSLPSIAGHIRHNLGLALIYLGRLDEATATLNAAMEFHERSDDQRFLSSSRAYLARMHLARGHLAEAEVEARLALEGFAPYPPYRAYGLGILASALLEQNRPSEALEAAKSGMELLARVQQLEEGESLLRLTHALALRAMGRDAEARAALGAARDRLLERAAKISDPALRESFLNAIPERRRTLELAAEPLGS